MSAISGIYYSDGRSIPREYISAMVDLLAHRGADDQGIWLSGAIALGHRMLWTTPESGSEKLPFVSPSGLSITADARIDNRAELISLLKLDQSSLPTPITDSQLILWAYEQWGESCVEQLLGDFAFAIWDPPKELLFCARDHFGVKPFYYYHGGATLVWASEIKALFCVPTVPRKLNEIRVEEFLTSEFYDKTATIYQQIFRLPPAHTLTMTGNKFQVKCYWSLDPGYELKLDTDAEYAAQFRAIFTEAVRCRLRSAYPVGSMLSGGMDSSAITCVGRKILTENKQPNLHSFSAVFPQVPQSDESFYINSVIQGGDLEPHLIQGDRISPLVDIEKIIWHQDEPQFAANLYLNWKAYELANNHGVRVVLDGFDGDSAVSHGFGYMRELARAGKWRSLIPELRGYCRNFQTSFLPLFWAYILEYGVQPTMEKNKLTRFIYWRSHSVVKKVRSRLGRKIPRLSSLSLINGDLLKRSNFQQYRQKLATQSFIPTSNEREEHFNAINLGSIPTTLELLDRTAASFSVELRYPFWDKRLVEFCLSLPANQKMRDGLTRMIMRRGLEGILPEEIQWRGDKGNLSTAFESGLRNYESDLLSQMIPEKTDAIANYVNLDTCRAAYQRYITQNHSGVDTMTIWKSINLALWLRLNSIKK